MQSGHDFNTNKCLKDNGISLLGIKWCLINLLAIIIIISIYNVNTIKHISFGCVVFLTIFKNQ